MRDCHVTKRIHSSVPDGIPYGVTLGKEGASRNHLRKKQGRERPMAQHSERRRRIAGRNVVVKQFVECLVISGEQQSGLLRNSGGGTGLRFLTAPNWLLPASVRSLARLLLTSSLLLPTCIQCDVLSSEHQ